MEDFGDFTFDEKEFAAGAGVSRISEAYGKVLDKISELAKESAELSRAGASKEMAARIVLLDKKMMALSAISSLDNVVCVDEYGEKYKITGENFRVEEDDGIASLMGQFLGASMPQPKTEITEMSEEEIVEKILQIVDMQTESVSFSQAYTQAEENAKISSDGQDHGDLGDIEW